MANELVKKDGLLNTLANAAGLDRSVYMDTIMKTVMPSPDVKMEQVIAFLSVAKEYDLNPMVGEIKAFDNRNGGIVPVVTVDGWSTIINRQPTFDGLDFDFPRDESTWVLNEGAKPCPAWYTCIIHVKGRAHPLILTEYLDETYQPPKYSKKYDKTFPGPWQSHTKRMLRHKALIQCARIAFGFSGIYDQDEAERIAEAEYAIVDAPVQATNDRVAELQQKAADLKKNRAEPTRERVEPQAAGEGDFPPPDDPAAPANPSEPDDFSLMEPAALDSWLLDKIVRGGSGKAEYLKLKKAGDREGLLALARTLAANTTEQEQTNE